MKRRLLSVTSPTEGEGTAENAEEYREASDQKGDLFYLFELDRTRTLSGIIGDPDF